MYFETGLNLEKTNQQPEEAIKYYTLAIEEGNNGAKFHLNCIYLLQQDHTKILPWNKIKLNDNDIDEVIEQYMVYKNDRYIQNNLGLLYELYKQDKAKANEYYTSAAEQGCHVSQYNLACFYLQQQNFDMAYKWCVLAAAQHYIKAESLLGRLHLTGFNKDYTAASQWLSLAAERGDVNAQYYLGILYMDGLGVQQDYSIALRLLLLAIKQGCTVAQTDIGYLFLQPGQHQDFIEARKWFLLAADNKDTMAQFHMGYIYYIKA